MEVLVVQHPSPLNHHLNGHGLLPYFFNFFLNIFVLDFFVISSAHHRSAQTFFFGLLEASATGIFWDVLLAFSHHMGMGVLYPCKTFCSSIAHYFIFIFFARHILALHFTHRLESGPKSTKGATFRDIYYLFNLEEVIMGYFYGGRAT